MTFATYLMIGLITAFLALYLYMIRNFNYWKKRGIPYIKPLPFFGNLLDIYRFKASFSDVLQNIYEKFDVPFAGVFVHDRPGLLIKDLEVIKHVLVKDFQYFADHTMGRNLKHDPMGAYMLFLLKNPEWRVLRKKVTPALTSNRIKIMFELIQDSANRLSEYLKRYQDGTVLEVREACSKYATDVITSIAFGMQSNCFNDDNDPFRIVSRRIFNFKDLIRGFSTTLFFISPEFAVNFFRLKFIDPVSGKFLKNIFWQSVKRREETNTTRPDVVDALLQMKAKDKEDDPVKLEGDALAGQVSQFFSAGFETVSSSITFTLFELAVHQDIQEKVRQEAIRLQETYATMTYDVLKEMTYLECCVKETLRKYPLLGFLDRKCLADYKVPGHDMVIKKGDFVYISIAGLQLDTKYFENPEKYIPERFEHDVEKFTFMPFGEGPRSCIGDRLAMVNVKSVIAKLITEYQIELGDPTNTDMEINPNGFLLSPMHGVNIRFNRLKH